MSDLTPQAIVSSLITKGDKIINLSKQICIFRASGASVAQQIHSYLPPFKMHHIGESPAFGLQRTRSVKSTPHIRRSPNRRRAKVLTRFAVQLRQESEVSWGCAARDRDEGMWSLRMKGRCSPTATWALPGKERRFESAHRPFFPEFPTGRNSSTPSL